jgi:WD40 repeat protein
VFSRDGKRAASHSGSAVLVWDARTGKPALPAVADGGHLDDIHGVLVSPDGRLVATNDLTGEIRVWDAGTSRPLSRIPSTWGNDRRAVFTTDSQFLIAVGTDHITPVVWDPATGREVRRFTAPADRHARGSTHSLRLSPDGATLLTQQWPNQSNNPAFAVRWDVGTGRPVERTQLPRNPERDIFGVAESPDGAWVVEYGKVNRVGTDEAVVIVPPRETGFLSPRFSADSRLVAQPRSTRGEPTHDPAKDAVIVFDLGKKGALVELPTGQPLRLRFAPDGRTLAVIGEGEVAVWELASGKRAVRFPVRTRRYTRFEAMDFTPDGRRLVTGMDDCTALVWDLAGTPAGTERDWWDALAGADAGAAFRAGWALAGRPREAVALLREKLPPVAAAPAADVNKLVAALDAPAFADREAAQKALRDLGDAAAPRLRDALKENLSAEQRQRVGDLVRDADATVLPAGGRLRGVRAVAVLERVATPEAKKLLAELAAGLPTARLTREAAAAAARLRDIPAPRR